jgi:CheY-like chemotaxis protein
MSVSILVVDDEPDVADLFRQRFRRESRQGKYIIHFAASGAEALDRLAEEIQPVLVAVLSDINMPGMNGLELLGEIKQRRPELPVMMVTAYGDDERRRRALELGALIAVAIRNGCELAACRWISVRTKSGLVKNAVPLTGGNCI